MKHELFVPVLRLCTLILGLILAVSAVGADTSPNFRVLPGQRILLNGDSIFRGFAFGNYTDPSPLRTIQGMAQILMKNNLARTPNLVRLPGIWTGLNVDGIPKTVDTLAGEIQVYIRRGDVRVGDWMIYEDAGELDKFVHPAPWPNAKDIYRRYRQALRDMVLEAQGAVDREHIRFMTMFDYDPKYPWCAWDAKLDDGVHSGNDAIRDEAAALGVLWIDMNRIIDRAQDYIERRGWGRVVGPDGIHPNVYGNFVMTLAILESLGADIARWKLDGLFPHFRHPEAGGDVKNVWGFTKDPSDEERITILEDLRKIVVKESRAAQAALPRATGTNGCRETYYPTAHAFRRMLRHGRILDHPARQPEGTAKPASYELGRLFQLDKERVLLVASLREQGGHDFEIGNDGFIFHDLSEIHPERAIPINRLESDYRMKSGQKGVLAKYAINGAFVPLGAKLADGTPHPAAGTGFFMSTALTFLPDRSEVAPNPEQFVEFYQARWDGRGLKVAKDTLPAPFAERLINCGFNSLPKEAGFLCPVVSDLGIEVLHFGYTGGRWMPDSAGRSLAMDTEKARIELTRLPSGKAFATSKGEIEPSLVQIDDGYLLYTRGSDRRGRAYYSRDGLNLYLRFDHWNHTVPQVLNQGLDGSLYLATNTGPGWLRNPLLAFALRGQSFVDPVIVHDEKQIGDDSGRNTGKEVPFCDHGVGQNVYLNGRWRHFLLYRVLDLRETNGEGASPTPQTGLYLAEFEYAKVTHVPVRF